MENRSPVSLVPNAALVSGAGETVPADSRHYIPPPAATATTAPAPVTAPPQQVDPRIAEAQAAMKAQEYERAAAALVQLQQLQLSEQQAAAARAVMNSFQAQVAAGVASGDPKVKAAAEMLRNSAMSSKPQVRPQ
jgi:hypothetical protein